MLLIIKVGGSLFSDKRLDRVHDACAMDDYAAQLAALAALAPGRVVLVSGGGAFGHGAVRGVDPSDPDGVLPLTEANFTLKWLWTSALRRHGARALPLQLSACCTAERGGPVGVGGAVRAALSAGMLPVLSGDAVVDHRGGLTVVGSDLVPLVLAQEWPGAVRIVVLTDVQGVFVDGARGTEIVRWLDPSAVEAGCDLVDEIAAWDTSDGMVGKITACAAAARAGADCHIVRGERAPAGLSHLLDDPTTWPGTRRGTRVCDESWASPPVSAGGTP